MIIELMGLPCSGKSTFAKHLQTCSSKILIIHTLLMWELVWYSTLFFIRYPIFSCITLWYIFREKRFIYMKIMNVFFHHNAAYYKATRLSTQYVVVLPEGHRQQLFSLFESVMELSVLSSYLSYMPPIDILVFFDPHRNVIEERIVKRGYFARSFAHQTYRDSWKEFLFLVKPLYIRACDSVSSAFSFFIIRTKKDENDCIQHIIG